jgi:alkylhydroperoxidase family enzyme
LLLLLLLDSVASLMQSLYGMVNHRAHRFHDTQSIRTEVVIIYFIYGYHT